MYIVYQSAAVVLLVVGARRRCARHASVPVEIIVRQLPGGFVAERHACLAPESGEMAACQARCL